MKKVDMQKSIFLRISRIWIAKNESRLHDTVILYNKSTRKNPISIPIAYIQRKLNLQF